MCFRSPVQTIRRARKPAEQGEQFSPSRFPHSPSALPCPDPGLSLPRVVLAAPGQPPQSQPALRTPHMPRTGLSQVFSE